MATGLVCVCGAVFGVQFLIVRLTIRGELADFRTKLFADMNGRYLYRAEATLMRAECQHDRAQIHEELKVIAARIDG